MESWTQLVVEDYVKKPDFSVAVVLVVGLAQLGFAIPQRDLYLLRILLGTALAKNGKQGRHLKNSRQI